MERETETPAAAEDRHRSTLQRAWKDAGAAEGDQSDMALFSWRCTEAAMRAVLPGRQTKKNTAREMDAAIKATARVIRSHGGELALSGA